MIAGNPRYSPRPGGSALDDPSATRASAGEPPGLREQLGETVDAARRLLTAHVELARAELGEIASEAGRVALLTGLVLGALLSMAMLLAIGGALFLGEWLFGSMGWGLVDGALFLVGVAVAAAALAVGFGADRLVRDLAIAIVLGVLVGVVLGLGLLNLAWTRLGEQFVPTLSPDIRTIVVGAFVVGVIGALLGVYGGARSGGMGGAIGGLVGGAIVGALLGAFTAITFGPRLGAALGVTTALLAWPVLMAIDVSRRGVDVDALQERFYPSQTIDTTKETIEWVRAQTPLGPKS